MLNYLLRALHPDAFSMFKRYYVLHRILEIIARYKSISPDQLIEIFGIRSQSDPEIYETTPYAFVLISVNYLIDVDLIEFDGSQYCITPKGLDILRNGVFQTLSTQAYFGFKGLAMSALSLIIAILALIISILL